jgi:HD-GYP domain-containing protein (c-di-GMP phosphodiesterase class II)
MMKSTKISIFDLTMALSESVDLVSRNVARHHFQVAYLALHLAREYGLPGRDIRHLVLAALLHDIGALSLRDKLDALEFEIKNPHRHSELGYLLLRTYPPFEGEAKIVRFHHVPWKKGEGREFNGMEVPFSSHIIHMADRMATLLRNEDTVLSDRYEILKKIEMKKDTLFAPELVEAAGSIVNKEFIWLEAVNPPGSALNVQDLEVNNIVLHLDELLEIARLFARIIDFRSRHTATHSRGVAAVSKQLGWYTGFSERECALLEVAGFMHDLGKLAVPKELLDEPRDLTMEERNIINRHPFYSYRLIERVGNLETVAEWASFHHETLEGDGYPFHLRGRDIPLGSRVVSVADIFTALTEDRPYRKGLDPEGALEVLEGLAEKGKIDSMVVSRLKENFQEIDTLRREEQARALEEYSNFGREANL